MSGTTRAQFLGRGAKGGLALVAGGLVLGVAEGTAFGAVTRRRRHREARRHGRAARDRLLHARDLLEAAQGRRAQLPRRRQGQRGRALQRAQGRARLGDADGPEVQVPDGLVRLAPRASARSARRSRPRSSAPTWAPSPRFKSNELKGVAAEIGACESRHLSVLTNIGANAIVPAPDLPKVLTAAAGDGALKPFLMYDRGEHPRVPFCRQGLGGEGRQTAVGVRPQIERAPQPAPRSTSSA